MPQIYLSGFVFPIQNMPLAFQWVTYAVPLRYYVTVLRGVFLKGVGLDVLGVGSGDDLGHLQVAHGAEAEARGSRDRLSVGCLGLRPHCNQILGVAR